MNEVWKHKLIFVETPDANETSIALENYRRVSRTFDFEIIIKLTKSCRLVITVVGLFYCLSLEEKFLRVSILTITTDVLSLCSGTLAFWFARKFKCLTSFTVYHINTQKVES